LSVPYSASPFMPYVRNSYFPFWHSRLFNNWIQFFGGGDDEEKVCIF